MKRRLSKLIIRTSSNRVRYEDGTTQILVYYHHQSTAYFNSDQWVRPDCWNKDDEQITQKYKGKDREAINRKIVQTKDEIDDLIKSFITENLRHPTGGELSILYQQSKQKRPSTNSYQLLKDFREWIEKQVKNNKAKTTIDIYEQTERYLEKFVGLEITPDKIIYRHHQFASLKDVNIEFMEGFRDWLSNRTSRL